MAPDVWTDIQSTVESGAFPIEPRPARDMNPADRTRLLDFLRSRWKDERCPLCGHDDWAVQPGMFALRALRDWDAVVERSVREPLAQVEDVVPVVPVVCKSCGNTVLVNAVVANLTKDQGKRG